MQIFAKSTRGRYDAKATYENGTIIVLKGSTISTTESDCLSKSAHVLRNDKTLVSTKSVVLKNIKFNSASSASNFVTGTSTDGLRLWKNSKGECLKSLI